MKHFFLVAAITATQGLESLIETYVKERTMQNEQKKEYSKPTIEKREELTEIIEGFPVSGAGS